MMRWAFSVICALLGVFVVVIAIATPDVDNALTYGVLALIFAWLSGHTWCQAETLRRIGKR